MRFRGKILVDAPGAILDFHQEYQGAMLENLKSLRDMVRARTPIGATGRLYRSVSYRLVDLTPGGPQGRPSGPIEFKGAVFSSDVVPPAPYLGPVGALFTGLMLGPAIALTKPAYMVCTYGVAVEVGTKPHWPPLDVLSTWAAHVLRLSRPEANLAAYFIGRKISKVGTRPQRMFERGRAEFMSSGVFERNIKEAADRAIERATVTTPWWAAF